MKNGAVSALDCEVCDSGWKTGIELIDSCLPASNLSASALHEIEPLKPSELPSLTGFCFGLLSRLGSSKPIIWCVTLQQVGDFGQLYAFGLERFGISPAQIVFAKVRNGLQLHFALEEALKTDGVAAVIGEGPSPDFTGSRRLSILCKTHNKPCILMNTHQNSGRGSAAVTRFQVSPTVSVEDPRDPFGPGLPAWRVGLPRVRGGRTMPAMQANTHQNSIYPWRICWDDQTHSFRLPTVFSNGAAHRSACQSNANKKAMVG